MNSTNWSEEQKANAGGRFANRLKQLLKNEAFKAEARRNKVAIDLSIAVAESGRTRQAVADKAGIKLSQLSRQLSGDTNLTLDSIGKICDAIGYDFDVVLRKQGTKSALQPWQQPWSRENVFQLFVNFDRQSKIKHFLEFEDCHSNDGVNDPIFENCDVADENRRYAMG
jgi:transcriptional regulator with XRE-family HTH domain